MSAELTAGSTVVRGVGPAGRTRIPHILLIGATGVGKSSTINALFGLDFATDNAVSCTAAEHRAAVTAAGPGGVLVRRVVIDVPGLGESEEADRRHWPIYERAIGDADDVVWLLQANTRFYRQDQLALRALRPFAGASARLTIGLNHADRIGPGGWDALRNEPSPAQRASLAEKVGDVVGRISRVWPIEGGQVIAYSARHGFGLDALRRRLFTGGDQP